MCLAAAPALGRDAQVGEIRVAIGDLNLERDAGARALLGRLRDAAEKVCGVRADLERDLRYRTEARSCVREAVDAAVERLNAPRVTALHENSQRKLRHLAERGDPRG
jgi:UrcA family protein